MSLRRVIMLAIAAVLAATPATAQQRGTIEFQGFGRYTFFDRTLQFDDRFGGGVRLGLFIFPRLTLEVDAAFTSTEGPAGASVSYVPIHTYLTYNQPLSDRIQAMLGAGYVHNEFGDQLTGSDNGVGSLLGLRFLFAEPLALRIDAIADYIPSPANLATENWHYGLQAGLSVVIGRPRSGGAGEELALDADGDGVVDRSDVCPNTAFGVEVDSRGCPIAEEMMADADGDGVEDSDDACPDTVAGADVDERGCPVPQDSDGDGVPDENDACPGTRVGARVDGRGCPPPVAPIDSDGDGVSDSRDSCPNTPAGAQVDARGCPLPADADDDGVTDAEDACPNTPAGVDVDARGCPVVAPAPPPPPPPADRDGDGVPDAGDACPNTPGGQRVDVRGCPIMIEVREVAPPPAGEAGPVPEGVLRGVTFNGGTAVLSPESRDVLDGVARSLLANPAVRVEIAGFTDSAGALALNMSLSQARANVVRWYLIDRGVPSAQMTARGYGPENPIASNDTPEGRAQNRRVELRRIN